MEVEYLLACGFSVSDNPVDTIAFEGLVKRPRDSTGQCDEVGGGRVVQVGDVRRVCRWDEKGMTFVDRLDVHEGHYRMVSIDPACREFPGVYFAEGARTHGS